MKVLLLFLFGIIVAAWKPTKRLQDPINLKNNLFAADVYREFLKLNSGSFALSPLSLKILLALVHNGAGGDTAEELATSLHLPNDKNEIEKIIKLLTPILESGSNKYILNNANKIYVKQDSTIQEEFKNTAINTFNSEIQNINFKDNEEAATEINKWVEEKTHDKIKDLINKAALSEETPAVLVSALYFHGNWAFKFPADKTEEQSFYPSKDKEIKVKMMELQTHLYYTENSNLNAKFLELPYDGNNYVTMTIVLPNDKDGLRVLEAGIADVLAENDFNNRYLIRLKLPKFEIKSNIEFKPILEVLGVNAAFNDQADFNGILVNESLKISNVIQKTFIEVNEEGTTATSGSGIQTNHTIGPSLPTFVTDFVADHPFVYYLKIRDVVFFVGRFMGE